MNWAQDMYNWFVYNYEGQCSSFTRKEIDLYRDYANTKYVCRLMENADVKMENEWKKHFQVQKNIFLDTDEELLIVQYYERHLNGFKHMNEPLPTYVIKAAFQFYKRFYLMTSVMDYHPKDTVVTCIFLACKMCDYRIPIDMFVQNFEIGRRYRMKTFILDQETELLCRLKFKLNIHSPDQFISRILLEFRKQSILERPERLVEHIERFLETMWFTEVCLMFTPPYIALAAVMYAVNQCNENINDFVVHKMLATCPTEDQRNRILSSVQDLLSIMFKWDGPPIQEDTIEVEKKLAFCRNPRNDPDHYMYGMFEQQDDF